MKLLSSNQVRLIINFINRRNYLWFHDCDDWWILMIDLSIILAKRNIFIDQRPTTLLVRAEENITFERDPFSSHCFFPCQFPKCRNYFSVFQTTREQLLFRFSPQVERRVKRQAPRLLDNAYVYLKSGISRRKIVSVTFVADCRRGRGACIS